MENKNIKKKKKKELYFSTTQGTTYKPGRKLPPVTKSAGTLNLDFSASRAVRNKSTLCKSLSLWYFVIAACAN